MHYPQSYSVSKTRTIPKTIVYPDQKRYSDHGTHSSPTVDAAGGSVNFDSLDEIIYSGRGTSHFNHCFHRVTRVTGPASLDGAHIVQNGGSTPLDCYNPHNGEGRFAYGAHYAAVQLARGSYTPIYSTNTLREYGAQAMARMRPDLTAISIPNFLLEMKDMKSLFKLYRRDLSTARNLGGLHLNWSFGWKPLLGDLQTIQQKVFGFRQKLDQFRSQAGKIVKNHCTLLNVSDEYSGTFDYLGNSSLPVTWNASRQGTIEAFVRFKPTPSAVTGRLEGLLAFLDTIGVQFDAEIVWNAIPFSFVVDWFLNVGDWLHQFGLDTLELPIELVDFCLQYKEVLTVNSQVTNTFTFGSGGGPVSVTFKPWTTYEKIFRRTPFLPHESDMVSLGWKVPSWRQFVLGLTLANALGRR